MRFGTGEGLPKSGKEYVAEYKKVCSTLIPLADMMEDLVSKDFLPWFKWVGSGLTGNSDEFIEKRVKSMLTTFSGLIKNAKMSKYGVGSGVVHGGKDLYTTQVLLGLFQVEVSIPRDPHKGNGVAGAQSFGLHIERIRKLNLPDFAQGSIELEFSKADVQELLALSTELLERTKKLRTLKARINDFLGSISVFSKSIALPIAPLIELFTKSGRVMYNITPASLNATAAVHNLGFGEVKQTALIAEEYLKRAR